MNNLSFLCLTLGLILLGCGQRSESPPRDTPSTAAEASPDPAIKTNLMLFVDRSISLDNQAGALSPEKLFNFLAKHHQKSGSILQVQLLHANTLGVPPLIAAVQSGKDLEDLKDEPKIVQIKRKQVLSSNLRVLTDSILNTMKAPFDPELSLHTDIWASMEIMSRFFAAHEDNSAQKLVAYYSDMLESTKGPGRRDFNKFIPEDIEQVKALAVTDAQWIRKNYALKEEVFAGIEVQVFATTSAEQSTKTQFVRYYWEALFAEFGIKQIQFYQ